MYITSSYNIANYVRLCACVTYVLHFHSRFVQEVEAEQEGSHYTTIQDGNALTVEIIKGYILHLTRLLHHQYTNYCL